MDQFSRANKTAKAFWALVSGIRLTPHHTLVVDAPADMSGDPQGEKTVSTGTGFRTRDFIGTAQAPDHAMRILFRKGLSGVALKGALDDFLEVFFGANDMTARDHSEATVPVLMPLSQFMRLV